MNKETFYFSHDYNARSDMKIKQLIIKHGYEAYGIYWAMIEDLYQNANALPLDYDCIAYDLRADSDIIKSIINDFELFVVDNESFGSLSVQRRLDMRNERSRKARRSAMKRWDDDDANALKKDANAMRTQCDDDANAMRMQCERNAIKESKGKESKGKSIVDTNVSMSDAVHPTQERIDYKAIIDFFNDETQGVFGKVIYPISEKRKNSIRARINEYGKNTFAEMIRKASKSNFLKGDSQKGFVAKFDWMIRPTNFQKIIEGNYDNRDKGFSHGAATSDEELMYHVRQGIARGIEENAIA